MYCKGVPKIVDHEQRRTEIIHALWQGIYEQGIHAASYQTVARAAGISVGRIQHYFTSKQDLVRAGCQAIVDTAESVHFGRTEALEPFDALTELLTQPIPRNNAFRLGTAVWYAYLAQAVADPQIMEIVTKACRETLDYAAGLLKQAGAPAQEAERLIALSNGLAQATMVGAATANEAVRILSQEVDSLKSLSTGR